MSRVATTASETPKTLAAARGGRPAAEDPGDAGRLHELRLGPEGIIAASPVGGTPLRFLGLNGAWCAIDVRDASAPALTYLPQELPPDEAVRLALILLGFAPPAPATVPDGGPPAGLAPARHRVPAAVTAPGRQEEGNPAGTLEPGPECPVCGTPALLSPPPPPRPGARTRHRAGEAERIARVITWMTANAHRNDVTAAEVAAVIGISVRRLQAMFRKEVGRRPLQLLRDIALYRVHLALTGQAPAPASIAEAARLAGYTRVTRFRAAYRAYFGQNPSLPSRTAAAARPATAHEHPQPRPPAAEADAAGTPARLPVHRKRALCQLAREQHATYSELYEQVLSETPGLTRYQARGRARTRLRHQFPGRYLELLAAERSGAGTEVPPAIRGKSWQRATARLADLRQGAYQARFTEFRVQGMTVAKAYDRAIAAVREANADLFARLLAEEYQLWLAVSGGAAPAGDTGSFRSSESAGAASATAAPRHLAPASMPGEGSDR